MNKQHKKNNLDTHILVEQNPSPQTEKNESLWHKIFWSSLVLMLGILWVSSYDTGFGSDEMDMNVYGKANITYYTSGFKDTSFLHPDHKDGVVLPATLPYYGSGFEYFATGITSLLGDDYEYNTRHILNQFFAVLGLLFMGLITARMSNYKAAVLSIWLLFLTPIFSGLAVFDTKDIPFLAAYIASIYATIIFFDQCPRPKWLTLIGLCFSLWFLLSIRIGGILMFGFMGIYALLMLRKHTKLRQDLKIWGPRLALVCAISFALMILTWPFILLDPAQNIIKTINVVKDFPQKIPFSFNGEYIDSLSIPKNYLPKMMLLTLPIAIQVVLLVGFIGLGLIWKRSQKGELFIFLLLSGIFPIVYAIYTKMPLYNSWRHLLFIYPSLMAASCAGIVMLFEHYTTKKSIKWAATIVLAVGLQSPIVWWIKNNPYQYTYYNELSGGYERVFYEYENDYWQITVKEAIDWLMNNEPILQSKDSLSIATNAYTMSNYYIKKRYPKAKVKLEMLGEKSRFGAEGVYSVFNNLFLEPDYLENCFPSPYAIHTVKIGGMPTSYVAKDTDQYSYRAYKAFNANNYKLADSFFSLHLKQIKYDGGFKHMCPFFGVIAYTWFAMEKYDQSLALNQKVIQFYPGDYMANLTMGALNIARQDYAKALYYLQLAEQIKPGEQPTQAYMSLIPKNK